MALFISGRLSLEDWLAACACSLRETSGRRDIPEAAEVVAGHSRELCTSLCEKRDSVRGTVTTVLPPESYVPSFSSPG